SRPEADPQGRVACGALPALQERVAARRCERIRMGNVWFDRLTFAEALDAIERLVEAAAGGAVFTPNVDHVVQAETDPAFRGAYARASLNLVDGQPPVWASRIIGPALPEKISGSDLVEPLMKRASERGWRVFLLGGLPGTAVKAAARFAAQGVTIAGIEDGQVGLFDGPSLVRRIATARPDLVLVALGAPKQELWIDAH